MDFVEDLPLKQWIEPARTGTAAFVGVAETGPEGVSTEPLRSFLDYQEFYGGGWGLLARSARAFFEQGGRRLLIVNTSDVESGLLALEDTPGVSLVAAPGIPDAHSALITHAERMRFRFALLDTVEGMGPGEALQLRRAMDSQFAALYYPWVRTTNDGSRPFDLTPPSAFAAGICARIDLERGVFRSPGGPLSWAAGLEREIGAAEGARHNQEGINCLRSFPGRGIQLWGARTVSSDPEWRYVSVRRYCAFLEESLTQGLAWAAFEPNGEPLWERVRGAAGDFLQAQWRQGGLTGVKAEQAFFVRCDRTTMSQDDIDEGRLVVVVGLAPQRPAEYVIVRIETLTQRP